MIAALQESIFGMEKMVATPHVRELSLRSLKRLINQLKEEFVRS